MSFDRTFGKRKLEALALASQGYDRFEIGKRMGLHHKSVDAYLADCYRLLGFGGEPDALNLSIDKALSMRLIPKGLPRVRPL